MGWSSWGYIIASVVLFIVFLLVSVWYLYIPSLETLDLAEKGANTIEDVTRAFCEWVLSDDTSIGGTFDVIIPEKAKERCRDELNVL